MAVNQGSHGHREPIRVAIVDDHRLVLDGLTARLGSGNTEISVVASATSWGDLLSDDAFPVDVVVLDMHLEDNIPIGTKVRALQAAGSAAIIMSRHSDSASVNAAMRAGALGFVPKTESADELVAAIRAAAASRMHLSTDVATALESYDALPDAGLGRQEMRALVLYARGRSVKEVAEDMETTEETMKSYIKRARRKYRQVGVDVGTRVLLRRHAVREGWISSE